MVRTYAIWNRDRRILYILIVLVLVSLERSLFDSHLYFKMPLDPYNTWIYLNKYGNSLISL